MIQINGIYCLEGDTYITNDIRRTGTLKWDPTFERILQHIGAGNGRTMVDVGAYIGDSTKWFEDAGFKCHAFEPMPDAFACLEKNVHPSTVCHNYAVGNGRSYATTTETEGNLGGRSLLLEGTEKSYTLDSLFPDGIDVLKIDAEGFEPFILEGAKEILKKKPIVIIEINIEALGRFGFAAHNVLKHLEDYEFEQVYQYGEGQFDFVCFPKITFAIAMPVCNRPEYTSKALEAIANFDGLIYSSIDRQKDETINQDVVAALSKHQVQYKISPTKLGCNKNVKAALDFAWESNPDVVICIEDDIVVTSDAFRYIKWAARRYKHDPSYRTIGLWSHKEGWKPSMPWTPLEATSIMEQSLFSVWGWATWRDRWQEMSDNWTTGPDTHDSSWDVVMLSQLNGRKEVVPSISRATNIGQYGGTHQGAVHPIVLASGFDTSRDFWAPIPDVSKKKVYVILGRFGDIYMTCKAIREPSIVCCSKRFVEVMDLFPQHEVVTIDNDILDPVKAASFCTAKYPTHEVIVCQIDQQPTSLCKPFRSYQAYQEYHASL